MASISAVKSVGCGHPPPLLLWDPFLTLSENIFIIILEKIFFLVLYCYIQNTQKLLFLHDFLYQKYKRVYLLASARGGKW